MFCELDTARAHAAPGPSDGSLYPEFGMNGAGGTGFGWKYGCGRAVRVFVTCARERGRLGWTYRLGLDQAHVVVLRVHEVVLVQYVVFACIAVSERTWARVYGGHSLAVPIIQTGPCDSDIIPRPV